MILRVITLLLLWLPAAHPLSASTPPDSPADSLPGVALAQGITEVTGVAISPLLGVSTVGAWRYFHAPDGTREELAWFCQPWAWGTGFVVLALCLLKDTAGAAAPGLLKKPFDMAELFEDKASALVAGGAYVPVIAREISEAFGSGPEIPTASILAGTISTVAWLGLLVPAAVVAFLTVWVCSHAINVLIVLSPFSLVDSALKLTRFGILATIVVAQAIAPWLGAALCLLILVAATFLAPSAVRLGVFGAVFATDVLLPRRARRKASPARAHVFTLGRFNQLPARTGGRLVRNDAGGLIFLHRPCFILPERKLEVPDASLLVTKGLLSPSITRASLQGSPADLFLLLPRYRGIEEEVATELSLAGTRDHALARGFTAIRRWLSSLLRPRGKPA